MSLFVDTSALLAFLDADQPRHADVIDTWNGAVAGIELAYNGPDGANSYGREVPLAPLDPA